MSLIRRQAASLAAVAAICLPALAAAQPACAPQPVRQAEPPVRKPSALGGLFAAARDAGLGDALAGFGTSSRGQTAAVAGAALSGDPASAFSAIPYDQRNGRTARLAGALSGAAANMARARRDAQAEACASAVDETAADADVWK